MKTFYFTLLTICLSVANFSFAQEQNSTPFNKYWKLGLTASTNHHFTENGKDSYAFKFDDFQTLTLGLDWNFLQFGNFNLRTGLHVNLAGYSKAKRITPHQNVNEKWSFGSYSIPIMVERYFPTGKNFLIAGLGLHNRLNFMKDDKNKPNKTTFTHNGKNITHEFNGAGTVGSTLQLKLGYAIPSSFGMFEIEANGGIGLNTAYEIKETIDNKVTGGNKISGNYIGLGIKFYPKK